MKKVLSIIAIAAMTTLVACGPSAEETAAAAQATADSTAAAAAAAAQATADSTADAAAAATKKK